jgi:hypothetical protein
MRSKLEQTKKFLRSKKGKALEFGAKVTLLAIARACDNRQSESVEIGDDELMDLVNEEAISYTTGKCRKLFELVGETENPDEKMHSFINHVCTSSETDLEGLCMEIDKISNKLKKVTMQNRKDLMAELRLFLRK